MPENLPPPRTVIHKLVEDALREDLGDNFGDDLRDGDLTAAAINDTVTADAQLICREAAVLCGTEWFDETFRRLDDTVTIRWRHGDGDALAGDEIVCDIHGNARAMLTAERTAINLLQTLSGTATVTRRYVDAVAGTGARIRDTRKTIPALRAAQKYAVTVGGADNHRMGLFDAILIKENHIAAAGSVADALHRARELPVTVSGTVTKNIQVEVESIAQLKQALAAGARRVLLDNFSVDDLRAAVTVSRTVRAELEASGNVSFDNVRAIAETGVDYISIGALTKNVTAVDFSLRFL